MASREVGAGDGDRSNSTMVVPYFLRKQHKPCGSSSSQSTLFDSLAEEELVEILRRLPLKLANQCKLVSKNWLRLIGSNHFATSYLRFHISSSTPPQFAIIHRYCGIIGPCLFRETPFSSSSAADSVVKLTPLEHIVPAPVNHSIELQFLASSNGWVLCSYPNRSGEIYYIVNPMTRHRITLPPICRTSRNFCRVGFVFKDPFLAAAGGNDLNHKSSSFRVVRFPPTGKIPDKTTDTNMKLDIFSSETQKWAQSTLSFSSKHAAKRSDAYDCSLNYHAIPLHGKLHWLHVWFVSEIFVYDPYEPEKYQRLTLPEDCQQTDRYCFGTCHCLGQAAHLKYSEWVGGIINVWELKNYDKVEWLLLHRVNISEITSLVYGIHWPPKSLVFAIDHPFVVASHPWDRDLLMCYYDGHFVQYNLRSKTLERGREIKADNITSRTFFLFELPRWPTPVPSPDSNQ